MDVGIDLGYFLILNELDVLLLVNLDGVDQNEKEVLVDFGHLSKQGDCIVERGHLQL